MTDINRYYVRAFTPLTFFLNGCRQKMERGGLYGPISTDQVEQVRRTVNTQGYQIIEDKGKLVKAEEAVPLTATIKSEIKISEPYKEDTDLIEELLKPVKISLSPTVSSIDKSQLPSVIPVGEETVSLETYSKDPVVIPQTPRLLQDVVDKNIAVAKGQEAESKAKASRAKKTEPSVVE